MNAIRRKYSIKEDAEFLGLLTRNIEDDYDALIKPGFYIDFVEGYNELIVLVFGEPSLVKGIDNFSNHLVNHYKAELV